MGHLGLVSGMIDELGIVETIDRCVQDGIERDVSLGMLCKALVLNGLGFSQRTLYMVFSFFENQPIELLLGSGITASQLRNCDVIISLFCFMLLAFKTPKGCHDYSKIRTKSIIKKHEKNNNS